MGTNRKGEKMKISSKTKRYQEHKARSLMRALNIKGKKEKLRAIYSQYTPNDVAFKTSTKTINSYKEYLQSFPKTIISYEEYLQSFPNSDCNQDVLSHSDTRIYSGKENVQSFSKFCEL